MLPALTVIMKRSGARRYTVRSSTIPPSGRQSTEYCTWPTAKAATSLVVRVCRAVSAPGPSTSNSPMWLTSKIPTPARVARCSSMIPVYWTGMSQPAKGTMRAPALTWAAWSGVRFSAASGAGTAPLLSPLIRSGRGQPLAQRHHLTARALQGFPHGPHDARGSRRVAMATDRLHRDVDVDAVDRPHLALDGHAHSLLGGLRRIGDERAADLARHQAALHVVGPIGEALR